MAAEPEKKYICSFCDREAKWYRLMGGHVRSRVRLMFHHILACDDHKHCLNRDARHDLSRQYAHMRGKAVYEIREVV